MKQIEDHRRVNALIEHYVSEFREIFGASAQTDDETAPSLLVILKKFGLEKSKELISGYLRLDDPWLAKKGFPLRFLKKEINSIIVQNAKVNPSSDLKPWYLVGWTQSGIPVADRNPNALKNTPHYCKPILWPKDNQGNLLHAEKIKRTYKFGTTDRKL